LSDEQRSKCENYHGNQCLPHTPSLTFQRRAKLLLGSDNIIYPEGRAGKFILLRRGRGNS
jgi:hypothetical protein